MLEPSSSERHTRPKTDLFSDLSNNSIEARIERALQAIADTQNTQGERDRARNFAQGVIRLSSNPSTLIAAIESNLSRGESPITPVRACSTLIEAGIDSGHTTPFHLIALGRSLADQQLKNLGLLNLLIPHLFSYIERGVDAGAIITLCELAKALNLDPAKAVSKVLEPLQQITQDLSACFPNKEQGLWLIESASRIATRFNTERALREIEILVEGIEACCDGSSETVKQKRFEFYKHEYLRFGDAHGAMAATRSLEVMIPLLDRADSQLPVLYRLASLPESTANQGFASSNQSTKLSDRDLDTDPDLTSDLRRSISILVRAVADLNYSSLDLERIVELTILLGKICPAEFLSPTLQAVTAHATMSESYLLQGQRSSMIREIERVVGACSENPLAICIGIETLTSMLTHGPAGYRLEALVHALTLYSTGIQTNLQTRMRWLLAISSQQAPPDLVRTYVQAMADERWRNPETSDALLRRLAVHSACHRLVTAETEPVQLEQLALIGSLTGVSPLQFVQIDPGLKEYRKLQEKFYPTVQLAYQSSKDYREVQAFSPESQFELLIPPIQTTLATWSRLADVHHGFGTLSYPSKRTPDGEAPLLLRYGMDLGKVAMLNALDNTRFPGKGFILHSLETDRIFAARPEDRKRVVDPLELYKLAWPELAEDLDHLHNAQFVFTRGFIAIAGVHPTRYSISRLGRSFQYSLVIFNAHFENPFNEVALLVPTTLLKEVLSGSFASVENYTGFDSKRANVNAKLPNPKVFSRHPVYGKYVINIGLPGAALFGVARDPSEPSSLHKAWFDYRNLDIKHNSEVRAVDKGFVNRWLKPFYNLNLSVGGGLGAREVAEAILNYSVPHAPEAPLPNPVSLEGLEYKLIQERQKLQDKHRKLILLNDPIEEEVWRCARQLLNLYDLQRISFAYANRGLVLPKNTLIEEVENGEPEDAAFNSAGTQMLTELYRAHSLHERGVKAREKFVILSVGDALNSSVASGDDILIDSFSMRGIVNGVPIQFSTGEMTFDDISVWQTQVMPQIVDSDGRIREFRLDDRASLPLHLRKIIETLV